MELSGLARAAKVALIEAEVGKLERSEVYITASESGETVHLAMPPERIQVKTAATFRSYNIVERGEVKLPKGEQLERISWSGLLPSGYLLLAPFVNREDWESPADVISTLLRWRESGVKVRLIVTQTPINLDMYIKSFDVEASGGHGHYKYSIELLTAKDLVVRTVGEEEDEQELGERPKSKSRLGARLNKIDNIYSIAKILTGSGSLADIEKLLERNGKTFDELGDGDLLIWN